MTNSLRIAALTLLCCALPTLAARAFSAPFEIQHDFAYARMELPSTVGQSTEISWSLYEEGEMWLHLASRDRLEVLSIDGAAQSGPLRSLNAEWNPDGSLGDAEYVFGKGKFSLDLVIRLLDGTVHTMQMRGATGPMYINVGVDVWDGYYEESGTFLMGVRHAKVDRDSAALFGIGRHLTGEMPYYVDVVQTRPGVREIALFGSINFDDGPANAVPEPATLGLLAAGLAGLAFRRSRK